MKLYTVYEFMKKIGVTDTSLIADMETKGFLTPANQTMAGTRYYSKQQIQNFDYLYSLYVDFCRKQVHQQKIEAEPTVTIMGGSVLPELKPLEDDINSTKAEKTFTFTEKIVPPSCTTKGYTEHICNENKFKSYKDNEIAALGHDYNKEVINATCTNNGKEIFTCTRCGHSYSNVIKASGHKYIMKETQMATCEAEGFELSVCEYCNQEDKKVIKALGHDFKYETIQEGNCTEDKIVKCTCARCNYENTETTTASGHTFTEEVVAPDCLNDGYTLKTCSKCNFQEKINITSALGHNYNEEIDWEATEYRDGQKTLICSLCQHKITEVIPKLIVIPTAEDFLKKMQAMKSENTETLKESLEAAKQHEEKINSYTGPMIVTGKKRF